MDKFKEIFELRAILMRMERDVGLDGLTSAEKDVFLAVQSLSAKVGAVVASNEIRNHQNVRSLSQATYHRILRTLLERGLLGRAAGSKANSYVVTAGQI
jgi:uncharacterized protein YceH (UPF0502 family)